MTDVAFVILHYLALNSTIECVESIKANIDTTSYKIIVVNNGSPDNADQVLANKYGSDNSVIILNLETNVGFANGNNAGFLYAKEKLDARYIVLSNNDIILLEKDFYKKTEKLYAEHHFAVLGPMIITKDGKYTSNPIFDEIPTPEVLNKWKNDYEKRLWISKHNLDSLFNVYLKIKQKKKYNNPDIYRNYLLPQKNIKLHGSFMVFSSEFITERDGLNPNTFMYLEEDILWIETLIMKKVMLYSPDIIVFHEEDASTNELVNSNSKNIFVFSNILKSLETLKTVINKYWEDQCS